MSNLYLTDEDIHGCEENEVEISLRSRIDKANEKIEVLEDTIKNIKEKISKDLEVNERCLKEDNLSPSAQTMLRIWVNYDKELLKLIKEDL